MHFLLNLNTFLSGEQEKERASRESTINDAERLFMMGLIQTRQAYSRLMENPCGSYVNATNLINANDDIYALAA